MKRPAKIAMAPGKRSAKDAMEQLSCHVEHAMAPERMEHAVIVPEQANNLVKNAMQWVKQSVINVTEKESILAGYVMAQD